MFYSHINNHNLFSPKEKIGWKTKVLIFFAYLICIMALFVTFAIVLVPEKLFMESVGVLFVLGISISLWVTKILSKG